LRPSIRTEVKSIVMNWGIRAEASLVESLRSVDSGRLTLGSNLSGLMPGRLVEWLAPFRFGFTAPTRQHVLVLVAGAILSPGRRTAPALPVTGQDWDPTFTNYHRVLNGNRWCSPSMARFEPAAMTWLAISAKARSRSCVAFLPSRRGMCRSWRSRGG
jgi:hypothetical protein